MCHSFSLKGGGVLGAPPRTQPSCFIALSSFYLDIINVLQDKSRPTVWLFFYPLWSAFILCCQEKTIVHELFRIMYDVIHCHTHTHKMSWGSPPQPNRSYIKLFPSSTEADGWTQQRFTEWFMFDLHLRRCFVLCISFLNCFVTFQTGRNSSVHQLWNCEFVFLMCKLITVFKTPEMFHTFFNLNMVKL